MGWVTFTNPIYNLSFLQFSQILYLAAPTLTFRVLRDHPAIYKFSHEETIREVIARDSTEAENLEFSKLSAFQSTTQNMLSESSALPSMSSSLPLPFLCFLLSLLPSYCHPFCFFFQAFPWYQGCRLAVVVAIIAKKKKKKLRDGGRGADSGRSWPQSNHLSGLIPFFLLLFQSGMLPLFHILTTLQNELT